MKGTHRLIVHGAIMKDEKLLILKRTEMDGEKLNVFPEYWDFPGGSVDSLELPTNALIREVKEETNLNVAVTQIIYEQSNIDDGKGLVFSTLIYLCKVEDSNFSVKLNPNEHTDYEFVNLSEIKSKYQIVPYVSNLIKKNLI